MVKFLKTKKVKNLKLFSALFLLLVLVIIFFSFVLYSSKSPSIFGKAFVYATDNIAAQINFFPKTSRQVLVRTANVQKNLKSYKVDYDLLISSKDIEVVNTKTSALVTNPVSSESKIKSSTRGFVLLPQKVEFDFDTFSTSDKTLFKINKEVNIFGINTKKFEGWYELDFDSLEKDLKVKIKREAEIIKDVNSQVEKILDEQIKNSSTSLNEEQEGGKSYYKVETVLKEDPLSKTFNPSEKQDSKLTLLVNKENFNLEKLHLSSIESSETNVVFDYKIAEHNAVPSPENPKNPQKINNPVELYLLLKGDKQPEAADLLQALGGEVKEIATSLLTIERLTKVVLLLPKSL